MIDLGSYSAGTAVKYRENFHNDTGTLEDPTGPEAQLEQPDGTFTALTAPAKINAKTGHYGGTVDTTGFSTGRHYVRMAGTVTSGRVVAREFVFTIVGTPSYGYGNRQLRAGESFLYRSNFHNDTGTLEDPTGPEAQIEKPDGTFTALSAPAKINAKTGHYGVTVDTTGFSEGQHIIRMAGTVSTAKTTAKEFFFQVVDFPTAADPKLKQILDAIKARFQTILAANGYQTDMGSNVFIQKDTPFTDAELEGMSIQYSDTPEQMIGLELHTLAVECTCVLSGADTVANVENARADVVAAIGTDRTWGGLAEDTGVVTAERAAIQVGEYTYAGATVKFEVQYTTDHMTAYV